MGKNDRQRIGLFIAGGAYAYQSDIIQGAHEESRRRGFDLVCLAGGSLGWKDPRNYCYEVASPRDLDAAILVPGTWGAALDSPEVVALLERYAALPFCVIGARLGDAPSVCVDNIGGVQEMTRHLIQAHGRKRVAFIEGRGAEARERRTGYERALAAAGHEQDPELIFAGDYTPESGRAAVAHFFRDAKERPDAIIAANDWMASGALEMLRERGARVPDDVALVGFDDIDRASFMSPPLTTIRQPPQFLGNEAVAMIDQLLSGTLTERHVSVPTFARYRRSCGCFGHSSAARTLISAPGESATSLSALRSRIAERLIEAAGGLAYGLSDGWAEQLIDALLTDLNTRGGQAFLDQLTQLVADTARSGNITAWYHVVAQLRQQSVAVLAADLERLLAAETLFGRAYITIGEQAEMAQGHRLLEREDVVLRLEDVSRDARTALDWNALCGVLAQHLPRFGIPRCYVAAGAQGGEGESRQLFAFEDGKRLPLPHDGIPFRTSEIVARSVQPGVRTSLVVHPLFMGDEILGHCCLEVGPKDGSIFKTLGDLISASVKATRLSEALVEEVTRRERAERERMLQELDIAARIQTAILPRHPQVPGLELATVMVPATEVGGDYFDILPCPAGAWIGIGDVAGHGLTAGLIMLMIQSIVAATVHDRPELGPARAWRGLNAVLSSNIRERMCHDDHATLSLLRYRQSGHVKLAGSHEDLIVYRAATGRCERVPTPGIWAGIFPDIPEHEIREAEFQLSPGDVLLLYTDGVIEARNEGGEDYGIERMEQVLQQHAGAPVQRICDLLLDDVQRWMATQDDDVTLVVLRHTGIAGAQPSS